MTKLDFIVSVPTSHRAHDAAYVRPGDDPLEQLVEAAIQHVSTEIEIECAGVKMHLAAWQDPEHWSEDWEAKGIDPDSVYDLVAEAVSS